MKIKRCSVHGGAHGALSRPRARVLTSSSSFPERSADRTWDRKGTAIGPLRHLRQDPEAPTPSPGPPGTAGAGEAAPRPRARSGGLIEHVCLPSASLLPP